jgi:hypothetical protein
MELTASVSLYYIDNARLVIISPSMEQLPTKQTFPLKNAILIHAH